MGEFILASFMILILLLVNWFPKTNRMEIESYDSEKMDGRNPLYMKNYRFRTARKKKRGSIFTADLKFDYYCQVMSAVQIILCIAYILYGIFSEDAETSTKIGRILFYWFCLHVFISVVVKEYYGMIFKSAYQSAPWKKWRPFEYIGNFTLGPDMVRNGPFKDFQEISTHIYCSCKKAGYWMKQEKEWSEEKKIWFWVKEEKNCIRIFETIRFSCLNWEDIDWLNETFDEFLGQVLKGKKKSIRICFTFFICVDEESKAFHYIMHRRVIQGIRRFRLPAGMIMEEGEIQIAKSAKGHGKRIYKKMCQEFFNILGIKDPRY